MNESNQSNKKTWIEPAVVSTRSASSAQANKLLRSTEGQVGLQLFGPKS